MTDASAIACSSGKEAWLKPVKEGAQLSPTAPAAENDNSRLLDSLRTRLDDRYFCQSTELYAATTPLSRWNITHFIAEIFHGELSIREFFEIVFQTALTRFLPLRKFGFLVGTEGKKHKGDLNLQSGEWIDIKQTEEIEAALDVGGKNCGLSYVPSMSEFIGGRYQVEFPVQKIILERTGKIVPPNPYCRVEGRELSRRLRQELSTQ